MIAYTKEQKNCADLPQAFRDKSFPHTSPPHQKSSYKQKRNTSDDLTLAIFIIVFLLLLDD